MKFIGIHIVFGEVNSVDCLSELSYGPTFVLKYESICS
jgi:hypothetical protein